MDLRYWWRTFWSSKCSPIRSNYSWRK